MEHTLPKLPYAQDALVPHISLETMQYHYGKHHQAYVDNLNKLIKGTEFAEFPLEAIIKQAPAGGIFSNAAQVSNHSFWRSMTPEGGGSPSGALDEAIAKTWGSVDKFSELFLVQAVGNFGPGWTWLVKKADGSLAVTNTTGAQTPLTGSDKPLLTGSMCGSTRTISTIATSARSSSKPISRIWPTGSSLRAISRNDGPSGLVVPPTTRASRCRGSEPCRPTWQVGHIFGFACKSSVRQVGNTDLRHVRTRTAVIPRCHRAP